MKCHTFAAALCADEGGMGGMTCFFPNYHLLNDCAESMTKRGRATGHMAISRLSEPTCVCYDILVSLDRHLLALGSQLLCYPMQRYTIYEDTKGTMI